MDHVKDELITGSQRMADWLQQDDEEFDDQWIERLRKHFTSALKDTIDELESEISELHWEVRSLESDSINLKAELDDAYRSEE